MDNNFFGKGDQPSQDQITKDQKVGDPKPKDHIEDLKAEDHKAEEDIVEINKTEDHNAEKDTVETNKTEDHTVEDNKAEGHTVGDHIVEDPKENYTTAVDEQKNEQLNLERSVASSIDQDVEMQEMDKPAHDEELLPKPESENINEAESIDEPTECITKATDPTTSSVNVAHPEPETKLDS